MSLTGNVGRVAKLSREFLPAALNQRVACLRIKDGVDIDKAFLFNLLNSDYFEQQCISASKGVAQKNMSTEWLKEYEIPIFSLERQRLIAGILDKTTELISLRKQQLAKLDELVKSRFVELFGGIHDSVHYPYVTIDSFATVKSGGTPDRGTPEYWENGTIRWVKTTELQNCIIEDTEEKITELAMNNSSAKLIPAASIIIAMYGQGKTRGMTGYLAVESTTNQACACILPSKSVNQKYLWSYMMLSYDKLRDMAKGGNQPNLNVGIIKAFPVLMPPMQLQEQFATFVEQTDKSKFAVQQSIEKLETLKKSLMQQYFG